MFKRMIVLAIFCIISFISYADDSAFRCKIKHDDDNGLKFITCVIGDDKIQITDSSVNRGRCNNTKSTPMNFILKLGLEMLTGKQGRIYEDFLPHTNMGEYGFGDEFLIITDCQNILEFAIETNTSVHTFRVN